MPFHLTSDQELIRKTVRELAEAEVKGKPAEHIDRDRAFPKEALQKLAGLGLTAMLVPGEKGGVGTDTVSFVLALEEVARASGTLALVLNNLNALGTYPLALKGTDAQIARVLPTVVSGEKTLAWALTEPNSGSDIGAMQTRATKSAEGWSITGLKSFVVGAPEAAFFLVFAKTAKDAFTAFLVPADAPGVKVAPRERTMSMRGSDMAQVFFKDVRVTAADVLGAEGEGLALAGAAQEIAGLGGAAIALGLMQASIEDAIQYSGDREQFRTPIKQFQAIQFLVAEMDLHVRTSRLLCHAAADKRDRGEDFVADVAAAKLHAAESAKFVTQKSLRIHGGTGFMRDLPVERYNRDARALAIYGGTSEAQKAVLAARALGL